jgi:hypothetical protein
MEPPSGSTGSVDMLAELEVILTRPKAEDRTDLQRRLRKMYEEDFSGFMRLLDREKDRRQKAGAEDKGGVTPESQDEGSENAQAALVDFMVGLNAQLDFQEQIARALADQWPRLPPVAQRAILDTAGVPYAVEEGAVVLLKGRTRRA